MLKKFLLVVFFVAVFLLLETKSFAGGGNITLDVSPQTFLNPGLAYTVTITDYINGPGSAPAKGVPLILQLENPQPSDVLNPTSDKTDDNGQIMVKVISNIPGPRVAYVDEHNDQWGTAHHAVSLNYTGTSFLPPSITPPSTDAFNLQSSSSVPTDSMKNAITLTWNAIPNTTEYHIFRSTTQNDVFGSQIASTNDTTYTGKFSDSEDNYFIVKACTSSTYCSTTSGLLAVAATYYVSDDIKLMVTGQSFFKGPKGPMRHVFLQWTGIEGNVKYYVYEYPVDKNSAWASSEDPITSTQTTIDLGADIDWYIRINACKNGDMNNACKSSPLILLKKLDNAQQKEGAVITGTQTNVDELNKKVDALQKQLEQSQKKQAETENTLNRLLGWIKSHFPFFH